MDKGKKKDPKAPTADTPELVVSGAGAAGAGAEETSTAAY
jgi:hypothetical protein